MIKNRLSKRLKTISSNLAALLTQKGVAVGYYDIPNFGDQLTPDILKYFGLRGFHCPNFRFSSAIGVGSILHKLPENYEGYILGSGSISGEPQYFPNAKVLLVRGNQTRKALKLPKDTHVGDPGLIADEVYADIIDDQKVWDIGIVPHYRDIGERSLNNLCDTENELLVKVIDVRRPPYEVIKDISCCKTILSSSLHGLIVADSIGVPNLWVKFSDKLIGGDFKFNDYYSCFMVRREPVAISGKESLADLVVQTSLISPRMIDKTKNSIHLAYSKFKDTVISGQAISDTKIAK